MMKKKRALARLSPLFFVFVLLLMFLGGCSFIPFPNNTSAPIDPPPLNTASDAGDTLASDTLSQAAANTSEASPVMTTQVNTSDASPNMTTRKAMYVLDAHGYLVPLTVRLPYADSIAKQVLTYMVKGGPGEVLLPSGFRPLLPEGTRLSVDVRDDGTAVVDFSSEFAHYDPADELKIVQGITWTLTEFPSIQAVQFSLNGYPLEEMPRAHYPLPKMLTRAIGLNTELADGAEPGKTSAVTLYFEAESEDGTMNYYVPVTRLIPRTQDLARAAMEELIKGPLPGSKLYGTVLPSTILHSITVQGSEAKVDTDPTLLGSEPKEPSVRSVQAVALTLMASTGVEKVHILINGKNIQIGKTLDLTQPVVKPKSINPLVL